MTENVLDSEFILIRLDKNDKQKFSLFQGLRLQHITFSLYQNISHELRSKKTTTYRSVFLFITPTIMLIKLKLD
jgi:hypothetical protein